MINDHHVVRRVLWLELCPWLMIFRCFRLSIGLPLLFLATLGALLAPVGDRAVRRLFVPDSDMALAPEQLPRGVDRADRGGADRGGADRGGADRPPERAGNGIVGAMGRRFEREGVSGVYWGFVQPVKRLFEREASASSFTYHALVALWNIGIWALFGGAITRIAVVKLGRDERISVGDALRHAARNYGWYVAAPLFPLIGVALLLVPAAVLGLLLRFDFAVALASVVWPVAQVGGLVMAIFLLGLLGGWPLMWPTISAEEDSDAFEAFNRSFSYTFQRPLQYLFYALVTVAFGQLSWILVDHFADGVIALNHWAISFGAGNSRVAEILGGTDVLGGAENGSTSLWAGAGLIGWWNDFVRTIAQAFNYSFFFCAASALYLLLRREVDQTDFDEIFLPDEATRYGLPPLRPGPEGVPEIGETAPEDKQPAT